MAARRQTIQNARWADDAGHIDLDHFLRREPVPLADGSTKSALPAADEAAATAKYEAHKQVPVKGAPGPARDYQIMVYGNNEREIAIGMDANGVMRHAHPDGFTSQYGAVGDSKHVGNAKSYYDPESLPEFLRDKAIKEMDDTLNKLQVAADKVMDGNGVVELTTNSPKAAAFIESRMKALGVRGYVQLLDATI